MMGNPCQFDRTTPTNFEWKKIRREEFSSEKEELTASTLKPNDLQPDVVLVSGDGIEFPAYKSVLCTASSYFRAMFGGAFREASSDRIVVHSITSRTMQLIMDYLHLDHSEDSGRTFEDSVQPVLGEVFCDAYMLDMPGLVEVLCILLGEGLTCVNYKKTWAIYDTCPTETLYDYLRASFRHNYRHLYEESCLTFDFSLMSFALGQWVPFVNHQFLVRLMLQWIQHSPQHREVYLVELAKSLHPERLPPGYMNYLAAEEEILQRHPDVLQQFQTSATTVDTVQVGRDAGYEVIADAISVLFFTTEDNTTTVERVSFSGCKEEKVLPFHICCTNSKQVKLFACVQYIDKIYFVGRVISYSEFNFIEYDFDNNSFVCMDFSPIPAQFYCHAFVVNDQLYVHCSERRKRFVQFYPFLAGCGWTRVLNSTVSKSLSLCPCDQNSYFILRADRDKNATKVTSLADHSTFTIPCKYNKEDFVVHYNRRLWGCLESRGRNYVKRTFLYDMDTKCFKSNCDTVEPVYETRFMRIDTLQRHPLIVKWEIYPDNNYLTLLDIEHDTALGQIEQKLCLQTFHVTNDFLSALRQLNPKRVLVGMMAYCKDLTL